MGRLAEVSVKSLIMMVLLLRRKNGCAILNMFLKHVYDKPAAGEVQTTKRKTTLLDMKERCLLVESNSTESRDRHFNQIRHEFARNTACKRKKERKAKQRISSKSVRAEKRGLQFPAIDDIVNR